MGKKNTHGGMRPGAGRKAGVSTIPPEKKKIPYSTNLRREQIEWLREQPESAGKILERLIDAEIDRTKQ